ncbi:hypothetical protein [Compostimonas suwonensis]|uniref:TadE-like protein n=1 Tax=Compostimonas suwonensis TaxID=1048394 RepID=A0A2M9BWR2_9MICO|nr:hypothetical protein [Compostimonas suwonensis]PJJ62379.1 hypothetical protein CLV54_2180 [Compostimonas suwonensis]
MPRARRWWAGSRQRRRDAADDDGSASLEFLGAGVLLLVPLVYLVLAVSAVQSAALTTEGVARQAARLYALSGSEAQARSAIERAVAVGFADVGVDPAQARVEVLCSPDPQRCLTRAGRITVTVSVQVPLPLLPPALPLDIPSSVPVGASATQPVSRFAVIEQ